MNDGRWSTVNPEEVVETNDRNAKKVIMFVAIINVQGPIAHAFVGEDGKIQSVIGMCYLELMQEVV